MCWEISSLLRGSVACVDVAVLVGVIHSLATEEIVPVFLQLCVKAVCVFDFDREVVQGAA